MGLKVYTASKLNHAGRWLKLVDEWVEIDFVARWPSLVGTIPDEPHFAKVFWQQDIEDVMASDIVLVYGEPGDVLRGALVEAGVALGAGKSVIVVGDNPFYGTWQHHPNVYRVPDLEHARTLLKCMAL